MFVCEHWYVDGSCFSVIILGSLSDPKELPGLAHFCEHMLFLGTKSFPTENTYLKYITDHGGHCNAFTSPDRTSYVFDVAPESLKGALDIFSQFFICPLFTDSATEREVSFNLVTVHGKRLFVSLL